MDDLPSVGCGVAHVVRTRSDYWTVLLMELVLPVHILSLQELVPVWDAADGTGPRPGNAGQWMDFQEINGMSNEICQVQERQDNCKVHSLSHLVLGCCATRATEWSLNRVENVSVLFS